MTVTYGFYNSINGDRKYDAIQMSRLFDGLITDGIYQSIGGAFAVTALTGMNVNVAAGRAWLDHTWTLNDSNLVLTVEASEPALNRIDTVCIEVYSDNNIRTNSIKIVKGTPAGSPVAPTMTNTTGLKQYPLANISVGAGVTSITSGNITNRIGVAGGTAFVTGIVSSIDFSILWGRYESQFNDWLANLQDQLDDNQAGNLQVQIDKLFGENNTGWIPVTQTWTYSTATNITVPSDATFTYRKGWGIRLRQGGGYKYFYITLVTPTILTVTGGSSYTLTNATITDISFSPNPNNAFGFPSHFSYFVSIGGSGSAGTYAETVNLEGIFTIFGNQCHVQCSKMVTNKGSWTGSVGINLPVAPNNAYSGVLQYPPCWWANGASPNAAKAFIRLTNSSSALFLDFLNSSFFDWADMAVNDNLLLDITYSI